MEIVVTQQKAADRTFSGGERHRYGFNVACGPDRRVIVSGQTLRYPNVFFAFFALAKSERKSKKYDQSTTHPVPMTRFPHTPHHGQQLPSDRMAGIGRLFTNGN